MRHATVTLRVEEPLDLPSSLTSGQCFRWRVDDRRRWTGVLSGSIVRIERARGGLRVASAPCPAGRDPPHALRAYFRIGDDLRAVQRRIAWDDNVRAGIDEYPGMRILRQEPWETLAAFILSSTSNMVRISRTVELLATTFGERLTLDGAVRHAFPGAAQLAEAGEARPARARLRLPRAVPGAGSRGRRRRQAGARRAARGVLRRGRWPHSRRSTASARRSPTARCSSRWRSRRRSRPTAGCSRCSASGTACPRTPSTPQRASGRGGASARTPATRTSTSSGASASPPAPSAP